MANKFVRGLIFTGGIVGGGNSGAGPVFAFKFMYEFFGFCCNGTSSLNTPGGFASTTPSNFPANFTGIATTIAAGSNGVSLPQGTINVASTTNFPTSGTIFVYTSTGTQTVAYTGLNAGTQFTGCTGGTGTMSTGNNVTSTSINAMGSDGYTNPTTIFRTDGYSDFFSASTIPFTSNMVGKQLVTWKPGSNSTEDSIYNIIAFKSTNNIVINVNNGGTPSPPDGYKPSFTSRSSINYRVVDMGDAGKTSGATNNGNYLVFQFDPTGINAGQATSQIQIIMNDQGGGIPTGRWNYNISPGGTWNGSAFTDGTGVVTGPALTNAGGSSGTMSINMWGDRSYIICHSKDTGNPNGSGFHIHMEIPDRLYAQSQDLNPIAIEIQGGNVSPQFTTTSTSTGYGGGFVMKAADGVARGYRTSVKALIGDGNASSTVPNIANPPGNSLSDFRAGANPFTGNLLNSPGFLTLPGVVGQYSLARVRLRNARFANVFMPQFTRFSSNGDFILISQGAALPWDKTVLPYTLFPF